MSLSVRASSSDVLADAYGPGNLVRQGHLPAAVIAGNAEFLRPVAGVVPGGEHHLTIYAVDVGRAPDGRWWVVRDRTQAPSGAGYALENRMAMTRTLSDVYRSFHIERHAPFFDAMRAALASFREPDDAGVCLLTPGPLNETYFEHAYLARYLGLRLVEGQDLTVRDQKVYLRTISGLLRVKVLLRRIDSDFADPVELMGSSRLGVPGLVEAIRAGNVVLANALGSGLAEKAALLGFMPALAQCVLGEDLILPNVATWWCGQPLEREFVQRYAYDMAIAPALRRALPSGPLSKGATVVSELEPAVRRQLVEDIGIRGVDYVGQEIVNLSTAPVWANGRLEPRPFLFRVYAARTPEGWTVMPGGLGLFADRSDARAVTMQQGARSADVCVLSDGPVEERTLLSAPGAIAIKRSIGALPSRAADNLFWLARYLERAEATVRVVRTLAGRMADHGSGHTRDITLLADLLFKWGAIPAIPSASAMTVAAASALYASPLRCNVPALVANGRQAAFVIRDRFPPDGWRALDDLHAFAQAKRPGSVSEPMLLERANSLLSTMAAVSGFQIENMNRLSGYRFLKLGRRIERAISTCRFVRHLGGPEAEALELDALLELADSQVTYRARYPFGSVRGLVLDLVLLDNNNPRSLAFQMQSLEDHMLSLPGLPPRRQPSPAVALATALASEVESIALDSVSGEQLLGIENQLMRISNEISQSFFSYREPAKKVFRS